MLGVEVQTLAAVAAVGFGGQAFGLVAIWYKFGQIEADLRAARERDRATVEHLNRRLALIEGRLWRAET